MPVIAMVMCPGRCRASVARSCAAATPVSAQTPRAAPSAEAIPARARQLSRGSDGIRSSPRPLPGLLRAGIGCRHFADDEQCGVLVLGAIPMHALCEVGDEGAG